MKYLSLFCLALAVIISCHKTKVASQTSPIFPADTSYLVQDICDCYISQGYNPRITSESCYFGRERLLYKEWINRITSGQIDSVNATASYTKLLFEYDSTMGLNFKRMCLDRELFPRSGRVHYRLRPNFTSNIDYATFSRQLEMSLFTLTTATLDELYKDSKFENEIAIVPLAGQKINLLILTIDFDADSIVVEPIFFSDAQLANRVGRKVGDSILESTQIDSSVSFIRYPLNYWEPSQIEKY